MNQRDHITARLVDGVVERQLAWMALPMVGGIFASMAFNLADTWFVSRLGTSELAAMAFTFPVVMIFMSVSIGLGAGTSSVVARALGSADPREIRRLATDSMVLATLFVAVFSVVGVLTIDPVFRLLGADATTLPLIRDYMVLWYAGIGFLLVPMVGNSVIRATGNTRIPSLIMIGGALLNVVLDPLLIFGLFGLPRLELQGAALATLIARAVTLVLSLWVLHRVENLLTFELPSWQQLFDSWRRILHVGLPAAATNMIIPATMGAITPLIASYGADAVAAFGAASRLETMSLIFFFALSAVIGPFVGQNLGAGAFERIRRALRSTFLFCAGFGAFLFAVFSVLGRSLAGLFSEDPAVVDRAALYLLILPIGYGMHGVVMNAAASFNALGKPLRALWLSLVRMVLLYLPLAWIGSRLLGLPGIWIGAATANLLAGALALVWSYQGSRDGALASAQRGGRRPSSSASSTVGGTAPGRSG